MMLNSTGYNYQVNRRTTNWRIVVLCISSFLHVINSNVTPCRSGDCDNESVQLLRQQQRLSFQKRENELIKKHKEVQSQLQKLYSEQQLLDSKPNNYPKLDSAFSLEYEIPSYCANCLGDIFETTSKSLSSEFARKTDDGVDSIGLQEKNDMPQLSDHSRLEAIKFQILLKLGLKNKPNFTSSMTKEFILETLHRSGDPMINTNDFKMMFYSSDSLETQESVLSQLNQLKLSNHSLNEGEKLDGEESEYEQDFEDFYGRTREIISFAEKGQFMFGDHLIAFSTSVENQTGMKWTKEKIRAASLWVMTERSTVTTPNLEKSSRDIEHLRQSNDNKNSDQSKNAILLKNLHNKLQRKQKKRKRKNSKTDGDSNLYQLEKYSYNHITNDNHIIENNRNEDTTKKTNSINLVGSSMYNRDGIKDLKANVTLWIFRIREQLMMEMDSKDMDDKYFDKTAEFIASKTIDSEHPGWQKIDMTTIVKQWYQGGNNEQQFQFLVDCSGCGNKFKVHKFRQNNSNTKDNKKQGTTHKSSHGDVTRPFLVVHIEPNAIKRIRRRALDCSIATNTQCCKQRFYVSFKALGWDDWIIAPPGYYANYCSGSCGGGINRTPDTFLTYYSHIFHEVRKYNKLNGNHLCCAPLKFSSMSLIYFGPDSKIIKRDLPKMVVDECGCP